MNLTGSHCRCTRQTFRRIHLKGQSKKIQPQQLALRYPQEADGGTDTAGLSLDTSSSLPGLLIAHQGSPIILFLVTCLRLAPRIPPWPPSDHVQDFYSKRRDLTYCCSLHPGLDLDSKKASLAVEVGTLESQQLVHAVLQKGQLRLGLPLLPRRSCGNSLTHQCIQVGSKTSPLWGGGPQHGLSDWLQAPGDSALIRAVSKGLQWDTDVATCWLSQRSTPEN